MIGDQELVADLAASEHIFVPSLLPYCASISVFKAEQPCGIRKFI